MFLTIFVIFLFNVVVQSLPNQSKHDERKNDQPHKRHRRGFGSYYYNYYDEIAMSICSLSDPNPGIFYPIRTSCGASEPKTCTQVCSDVAVKDRKLDSPELTSTQTLICVNSLRLYKNRPVLNESHPGPVKLGLKLHRYDSCDVKDGTPNYCCCKVSPLSTSDDNGEDDRRKRKRRSFKYYYYNYYDEIAMAVCANSNNARQGSFYPVRRVSENTAEDCSHICTNIDSSETENGKILTCTNSLQIYLNRPVLEENGSSNNKSVEEYGLKLQRYDSCSIAGEGPNYCCCKSNGGTDESRRKRRSYKSYFYNFYDEIAISVCADRNGTFYPVRRLCGAKETCNDICSKGIDSSELGDGEELTSTNSLHISKNRPALASIDSSMTDAGELGLELHNFLSATIGGCGPNYCCCKSNKSPENCQ